jgi:DNA-binding beta-propeller fold protein YncE
MFILGQTNDAIIELPLSTAWDVTTAGSETARYSIGFAQAFPNGLFINSEGSRFVICGDTNDDADQFVMGGFIVGDQDGFPKDVFFKTDGTRMYMLGDSGNDVNEYSLSTAWDLGTATFTQRSGTLAASSPSGLSFKPDGTRMYVLGFSNELVYEYSLSTAWDVSTITLVRSFSVTTQEPEPSGLYFKPDDGTKMYVGGRTSGIGPVGQIHEYSLSTGWDVSTATFVQTLSVTAQEQVPQGISFKPDGSKMFIDGYLSDSVHEYNLSTAWDISTAIFSKSFSMRTESLLCTGLYMKDDGTAFYVPDSTQDRIFTYSIGEQ